MKERIRTLLVGILIGALLVPTAFATVGTITKELSYNNIKITLDDKEIKPADANGNYVEPFIMDGTTYLPVRGIASALGLDVAWDGNTNTVKLSSEKKSEPSTGGVTKVGDVVYDFEGVKLILSDIKNYGVAVEYKFTVDNQSGTDIRFHCSNAAANGFTLPRGLESLPVTKAGDKAETSLRFATGSNSSPKIEKVDTIKLELYQTYVLGDNVYQNSERQTITLKFN